MRLKMRAVDHRAVRCAALGRKVGEDSVEDTDAGPANEPVVERLVGAIDRGRIPPSQTIPDDVDYSADHTPGLPPAKCRAYAGKRVQCA